MNAITASSVCSDENKYNDEISEPAQNTKYDHRRPIALVSHISVK